MLAKCCCNKDDRDRGFSSVRGTHSDVDLAEKFNQVINHVRRGMKVSHHLCLPRKLWLLLLQMYWHTMLAQAELDSSLLVAKDGEKKRGGDRVELRELALQLAGQCHQGSSLNGAAIIKRADQLQGEQPPRRPPSLPSCPALFLLHLLFIISDRSRAITQYRAAWTN